MTEKGMIVVPQEINMISLNVGVPKIEVFGGKELETGICKSPKEEAFLSFESFQGDGVANTDFHGGPERAVCVYPYEHYSLWKNEFHKPLPLPAFGENLTVTGLLEKDVCIGDIFEVGDTVLQVTQGRIPCDTISQRNNITPLLKRIVETGYTGYFLKVLKEGVIQSDAKITLIERDPKQISILFANQIGFHDSKNKEAIAKILEVKALAGAWRSKLEKMLHT